MILGATSKQEVCCSSEFIRTRSGGDQSVMEELDGKLGAFDTSRTLIVVTFALAMFAVMCSLNFMSTLRNNTGLMIEMKCLKGYFF